MSRLPDLHSSDWQAEVARIEAEMARQEAVLPMFPVTPPLSFLLQAPIPIHLQGQAALHPPRRWTAGSVGHDLVADIAEPVALMMGRIEKIPTGLSIAIPRGLAGRVSLRSSVAQSGAILPNGVATIDPDYRGVIHVPLLLLRRGQDLVIHPGERIAQLVIAPVWAGSFEVVAGAEGLSGIEALGTTERGDGGFGSTGQ